MENEIYNIINRIEKATEELNDIGTIPEYFKDDILDAIDNLIRCAEKAKTDTKK